jgi:hypothetical protein
MLDGPPLRSAGTGRPLCACLNIFFCSLGFSCITAPFAAPDCQTACLLTANGFVSASILATLLK